MEEVRSKLISFTSFLTWAARRQHGPPIFINMSKEYLNERERTVRNVNFHYLYGLDMTDNGNPVIHKGTIPKHVKRLCRFDEINACQYPHSSGVHFFTDDYRFERIWSDPQKYLPRLSEFPVVLEPDFSMYFEYPEPLQRWNHYRNQLVAAWLQSQGVAVLPVPSWADERSLEWCFDGIEDGSAVAISTVGITHNSQNTGWFMRGIAALWDQKHPAEMLVYGKMMPELKSHIDKHGIKALCLEGTPQQSRIKAHRRR